jgi:predicted ABC-type ATPase
MGGAQPLLLITGPPGAGKSTVTRLVAERFEPSVLIDGDMFFEFLGPSAVAPWLPQAREQNEVVTRGAARASGLFASEGYATIYDGVVGPWFLPTFAAATGLDALDYVILLPSLEVCLERVKTRVGHGFIDEAATRKMYREFAGAEIAERHILHDPPDDAATTVDLIVMRAAAGTLRHEVSR